MSDQVQEQFGWGFSSVTDWHDAIDACLETTTLGQPHANLGFVYVTSEHVPALEAIIDYLKVHSGIDHWVGTSGIGIVACETECYDSPGIAILTGAFPADGFRVLSTMVDAASECSKDVQTWLANNFSTVGIVHADPHNPHLQQLIPGLSEILGGGFLLGGLTSTSGEEHQQVADGVTSGGISGVLFSEKVSIASGLSQGCSPLGPNRTITECDRNLIVRIDDRPALTVFKEDIGEPFSSDLNRVGGQIFVGLSVTGSDTGDYVVRNLIGIDVEQEVLAIGEHISPGEVIVFCKRDSETARKDLVRMAKDVRSPKGHVGGKVWVGGKGAFLIDANGD
ncbi:MAG TPA: histidine kinase, partial [Gammaproteobacteria bacterium]|nr:histidine kinase [Gammaproteobacteria bacterium]